MKAVTLIIGLTAALLPVSGAAGVLLQLPSSAVQKFTNTAVESGLKLPVGPFANGKIDLASVKGTIERSVWNISGSDIKTIDLLTPLRQQLEAAGYGILYECSADDCGGFDFRFKTDVVDEPTMHVDLGDFRYLAASRLNDKSDEFVGLLVSRSPERGFVQITRAGLLVHSTETDVSVSTKTPDAKTAQIQTEDLGDVLKSRGSAVLEGLEFLKGSSELSGKTTKPLEDLSQLLKSHPDEHVFLVGHTDAVGSLSGNVALSRKRAESVMKQLIETYGVPASQLSAEGVGYLAPRASNESSAGRKLNRRVEVVLK